MTHKCEYCDSTITPCGPSCASRADSKHVCCTCDVNKETCELPYKVVCDSSLCNLKYQITWYEIKLKESQGEVSKLKSLVNQFRIINFGTKVNDMIEENAIRQDIDFLQYIKLFVAKQRLTWEDIPVETGYRLLCLHEEFSKMWAGFLNEKSVKIQIRKELIQRTESQLAKNIQIREGKLNQDGSPLAPKTSKVSLTKLNDFEKVVLHNMKKLGLEQSQSETFVKSLGLNGEARNLTEFL